MCLRAIAGPAGARSTGVDLSAAHAGVRFFAPIAAYKDADQALAAALEPIDIFEKLTLDPYAKALPGVVCALPENPAALGQASVEVSGGVALVRPGTGTVTLPEGVQAVAIDLRDLPEAPGLREALEAAVSPALAAPVPRPFNAMRKHHGMTDEVFAGHIVYDNSVVSPKPPAIPATGSADLPIAVLTGPTMAPSAADLAISLRVANRAFVYGEDLLSAVAEMRWQGVGATGVAYRNRVLGTAKSPLPDVILADRRSSHPECLVADLPSAGPPPAFAGTGAARSVLTPTMPNGDKQPATVTLGGTRAALVIAHGAMRTFFPYFATVGDHIDDRLDETLGSLGTGGDRKAVVQVLERLGNAITDGHQFVADYATTHAGYFPVYVEEIGGEPVVRRSGDSGVSPGDTITSIDGVSAMQWYQAELQRTSAASDGYRFFVAGERYQILEGPLTLGLRDPDGNTRTVTVQPHSAAEWQAFGFAPVIRPAGSLADLGAPGLYYINMDGGVLTDVSQFNAALTAAVSSSAKGLVVDMRGYPNIDHYEAAERLINAQFSSPVFNVATLTGPDQQVIKNEGAYPLSPLQNPSFTGPIVLLVGHSTVSAAENFSIMLVDAQRVKVMGRHSASTNGDITGVQLPGSFAFTFTGMEVRHADAQMSVFHGAGIVPDTESTLTAAALRDGKDPELQDAVAWLLSH